MMDFGAGGMFMWLILTALAILLIYIFIVQPRKSDGSGGPPKETALDILKKRYAKGDITKEEFENLKRDIES